MCRHPVRKRLRLAGFDYASPGAYFITVCTHRRECRLGVVHTGEMMLAVFGEVADQVWRDIPGFFPAVTVDALVVIPNHLHAILAIHAGVGAKHPCYPDSSPLPRGTQPRSIQAIVQNAKSVSARQINALRGTPGAPAWQRGYYEHIIRSPRELGRVRHYIECNPLRWEFDRENPSHR